MNHFRKLTQFLRCLFRYYINAIRRTPPAGEHRQKPSSSEGWEFVADFDISTGPAAPPPQAPGGLKGQPRKPGRLRTSLPPYPVIWVYFIANNYPEAEARRFYKRYQVLGWNDRIIPTFTNWQELADHWMKHIRQPPDRNKPKS